MDVPIESVDDLADQTTIEYGTIHGGSSMTFFQVIIYRTVDSGAEIHVPNIVTVFTLEIYLRL